MAMINAKAVADSLSPQSDRLFSVVATFPRYILAELNTHRMLSKNTASSRAIPFKRMIESIKTNPFIPIAFQKEHSGMQGNEYLTGEQAEIAKEIWLQGRDSAVHHALQMTEVAGATKQIANRQMENYMYITALISGTEWENFFALRCPQYYYEPENLYFRSRKDWIQKWDSCFEDSIHYTWTDLDWLKINSGKAEIHMMALAEAIWDAMNESTPKQLKAGEWHIPFEDKIVLPSTIPIEEGLTLDEGVALRKVEVSTAMCARTSYTVVGDEKEMSYEKLLDIYNNRLLPQEGEPFHASPFEHCARVMNDEEYITNVKGECDTLWSGDAPRDPFKQNYSGWCRNFRGFIQFRHIIENGK